MKTPIQIFAALLFVLFSSHFVLEVEYGQGRFFHYFYKASVWYADHNKIIFPVNFWACALLFWSLLKKLNAAPQGREETLHFLKCAFFYHLYLVLLTHTGETVDGFALFPPRGAPVPHIAQLDRGIVLLGFVIYYVWSLQILKRGFSSGIKSWELAVPFSLSLPYLYSIAPQAHLGYLALAGALCFLKYGASQYLKPGAIKKFFQGPAIQIGVVFLVGLTFRIWYANFFADIPNEAPGFAADGPTYFKSAQAFARGDIDGVNFWHSPFYALYLSVFLFLFGPSVATALYSQAAIGSLIPVLVYALTRKLGYPRMAFLAGILTATSNLCIHFSVVLNRAAPLTLLLPLIVILALKSEESPKKFALSGLGAAMGAAFYFGPESVFFLAFVGIYLSIRWWKKFKTGRTIFQGICWMGVGFLLALLPMNLIHYDHYEKWIPLGRDAQNYNATSTWNYNNNPHAKELIETGFNPFQEPGKSIKTFLEEPVKISTLIGAKLFSEIPGFWLDPTGAYLTPQLFAWETFIGGNMQFYIYIFIAAGLFLFIKTRVSPVSHKIWLLSAVGVQMLATSLLIFGTFRFRAPIAPFNMFFMAFALYPLLAAKKTLRPSGENALTFFPAAKIFSSTFTGQMGRKRAASLTLCLPLLLFGFYLLNGNPTPKSAPGYELTPWVTVHQAKLRRVSYLSANTTGVSFYEKRENDSQKSLNFSFNVCSFLAPEIKTYYRLALDGKPFGPGGRIQPGCRKIEEAFHSPYKKGMLSLYYFISRAGLTAPLENRSITLKGDSGEKPFILPLLALPPGNEKDKKTLKLAEQYGASKIKISDPVLAAGS